MQSRVSETQKVNQLENCVRLRIEIPTALRTETLTLALTFDLELQYHETYGHDQHTCKKSSS